MQRHYSYTAERDYYQRQWPSEPQPYIHLEPYLRCWMDPDKVFSGKKILTIGAGEAVYERLIAEKFGPERVVASDLFLERMYPASLANKVPHLSFVAGDCLRLPFCAEGFDIVFGSLVLHQIADLNAVVTQIRHVLKPGGLYVGIEINPRHPLHVWRHFFARHSANQFQLSPKHLSVFSNLGFQVDIKYFWGRYPKLRNRLLMTTMGIVAEKENLCA